MKKKYKYNIEREIDEIIYEDNTKLNLKDLICLFVFGFLLIFNIIKYRITFLFLKNKKP